MGAAEQDIQTICILRAIEIAAPLEIAFEAILEEIGPGGVMPDGEPCAWGIEPWPDGGCACGCGENSGPIWGHAHVIQPPTLLGLGGRRFTSVPGINHLQYRLTAEGSGTRLKFRHTAMGRIAPGVREGLGRGWDCGLKRSLENARRRKTERR